MTTADAPPDERDLRRSAPPTRWRYAEPGRRDLRLDLIRGYALAAMAVNHLGLHQSYVHTVSGRSSFLISAAEVFLFVSGYTLGFISFGRPAATAVRRLVNRTWAVYLATIGISLGLSAVAMATTLQLWGEFEIGTHQGPLSWLADVVTMRGVFNGADILIAYVVYLGVGVGALWLLHRGRTAVVIAATVALYALGAAGFGAENLGIASFRALLPNAPLFFGGLVIGYHRHTIDRWWSSLSLRPVLDVAVMVAAVGLGVVHAAGWPVLGELGRVITGGALDEPLWIRESVMPIGALAVVGLYMRAVWLVADRAWGVLRPTLGWLLVPLGQAGLFTFVLHLVAIAVMFNLPGFPYDDASRVEATVWVLGYLGLIRTVVEGQRRTGAWLAERPDVAPRLRSARPVLVATAMGVAMLTVGSTIAADQWGTGEFGDGEDEIDDVDDGAPDDAEFDG
ncbi:MAG: OpgC domain-containing protein [Actinomycetota bacterium]